MLCVSRLCRDPSRVEQGFVTVPAVLTGGALASAPPVTICHPGIDDAAFLSAESTALRIGELYHQPRLTNITGLLGLLSALNSIGHFRIVERRQSYVGV